jgi:hypothetical protein
MLPFFVTIAALAWAAEPIHQTWTGHVRLEGKIPGPFIGTPLVVRTKAAYAAFVDTIPAHRIQMRQPAPPSEDPLLKRPDIDFNTHMLLVVRVDGLYANPTFVKLTREGADLLVDTASNIEPNAYEMAQPYGIGTYIAALVDRVDGEVRFDSK